MGTRFHLIPPPALDEPRPEMLAKPLFFAGFRQPGVDEGLQFRRRGVGHCARRRFEAATQIDGQGLAQFQIIRLDSQMVLICSISTSTGLFKDPELSLGN